MMLTEIDVAETSRTDLSTYSVLVTDSKILNSTIRYVPHDEIYCAKLCITVEWIKMCCTEFRFIPLSSTFDMYDSLLLFVVEV